MSLTDYILPGLGVVEGGVNFWNQRQNLKYQKELQKQIFEREDNAVQRRAADLQKAGLSKTLAAGSGAGAGSVIQTTGAQSDTLDRVIAGLGMAKTKAETKLTENQAANEAKRGAQIDEEIRATQQQTALNEARTLLIYGNYEMLGINKRQAEAMISQAEANTKSILKNMGYTDAQISHMNALTGLVNSQKIGQMWSNNMSAKEYSMMDTRQQILEQQLAGLMLDNTMKGFENTYTRTFGEKMASSKSGWLSTIKGGLSNFERAIDRDISPYWRFWEK